MSIVSQNKEYPLISVIVPVFNAEPYLIECFKSIVSQTYPAVEIILVDDGSTDGSSELCDKLVGSCPNSYVIHKHNGGLSDARNVGLESASGEWIAFVDSDDYISPVFLEALFAVVSESETLMSTVRFGVSFFSGDEPRLVDVIERAVQHRVETDEEYQEELLYQKSWNGSVWRLCHKSLFDHIRFPVGLYYEDTATTYRLVREAKRVAVLSSTELYAYRQNENSIMRGAFSNAKLESCLQITRTMRDEISEWYPRLNVAVSSRCFAICRVVFSQVPAADISTQRILWEESQLYAKTVLSDPKARKREKVASTVSLMGRLPFRLFCGAYRRVLRHQ